MRRPTRAKRQLRLLPDAETADPRKPNAPALRSGGVKVHVYPDGSHTLFHGPRRIGRYDEKGKLKDDDPVQHAP
jgi:hypothetical protein